MRSSGTYFQRLTNASDSRGMISLYYSNLDLVKIVDRLGFVTTFGYDASRHLTSVTDALSHQIIYGYCTCGALESVQDALGNVTSYVHNNVGWVTGVVYTNTYSLARQFDMLGRATNVTDSSGVNVTNWFNNQGLRYAVNNYLGLVGSAVLDSENRPTNTVDANGVTVITKFDALGRITDRIYPDVGAEKFIYTSGLLSYYTNQLGQFTSFGYDAVGRRSRETDGNGNTTSFTYDGAGDLLGLTDAKLQTTSWGYDLYGRPTNKVDAAMHAIFAYQYDADDRLINRWTPVTNNTAYGYDLVGNLISVVYSGPHPATLSYAYDANNRLTNMVDGVGTTGYAYDAAGQLLAEDGPWSDDTVNYSYLNRLRTGLGIQQPNADAWGQSYAYDAARRLTNTTSPAGSFGYQYDPSRKTRVGTLSLPNYAIIANTFDTMARLLST